jgi:tRNA threonylcarbamoyladenosine biosynthesis protein TsaB
MTKLNKIDLYIDTADFNKATFAVSDGKKIARSVYKIDPHRSYETLSCLEKFLLQHKIKLEDGTHLPVKKIVVNKGPGSYTGVRVGMTIAMALGFVWNVPVKALSKEKFKIGL